MCLRGSTCAGAGATRITFARPQRLEDADVEPADVELPAMHRELRRARERVVVVVQLFAGDQEAPRHDVARRVRALEIAIAVVVADAVDDAGRHQRVREHLHGDA